MRFLKITGSDLIWGKNEISRDDLAEAANGKVDMIVDTQEQIYFSPEENKWLPIPHD